MMKPDLVLARRSRGEEKIEREYEIIGEEDELDYHLPYFNEKEGKEALQEIMRE